MKPILIGEAPGPNGDPEKPLDGRPAARLLECMGHQLKGRDATVKAAAQLELMFDLRNLLDRPMEREEGVKGCEWPEEEARAAASRLALLFEREQRVVFLGKRVAAAFGVRAEWFRWFGLALNPKAKFAVIPHPSGIVRTWNDPVNRVAAGMVLWQAMGKIPVASLTAGEPDWYAHP